MQILTSQQLREKINSGENFIVDMYADWCGPCRVLGPIFEKFAKQLESDGSSVGAYKFNIESDKELAAELGVGIITIGHTNDDGAVKYCRMIEQRASVVVELQRDKMSEDSDERNTTRLLVTKNRPVGPTGYAGQLKFNTHSFTLEEKYASY